MGYSYITFGTAKQLLADRLYDSSGVFWNAAERGLYIIEAIRTWNALTGQWATDYVFSVNSSSANWLSLNAAGSPRQYTLTDADLYTLIQYHLLEPPTGANAWTGTPQFSLSDLNQAFQRRQDEMLQLSACNVQNPSPVSLLANTRRVGLADTVLDVRRSRFIPVTGDPATTLWREDAASFQYFSPAYRQTSQLPRNYSVSAQPPLTIDVDFPPNVSGDLDLLAVVSGTPPNSPTPVALCVPNDWSWVLKWGMLGDLLGKESEARDELRMQYSNARFAEGCALMQKLPWLLGALVNNVPVGISAVKEMDSFSYGWEDNPSARPAIVVAGTDLISTCPRPAGATILGVTLQVIQNAPCPVLDADPIQVPRDVFDVIMDYAFHIATFKEAGKDFMDTMPLFDNFRTMASQINSHLQVLGPFRDVMDKQGRREEDTEPRFTNGLQ